MLKEKTQADRARIIAQVHFKYGGRAHMRQLPLVERLLIAKECMRLAGDTATEKKIDGLISSRLS
ncbi:Uncharacterised protein [uncultured archaeon]|nr:Uncharacterised protein [uncultured archaeon]